MFSIAHATLSGMISGGGASAPPGPEAFGDLVAWIDPRYNITHTGNLTPVTAWTSKDPSSHIATLTNSPIYLASAWNGLPVIQTNGTNNWFAFDSVASHFSGTDKPLYVVCAYKPNVVSSIYSIWHFGRSDINPSSCRFDLSTTTIRRFTVVKRDDALAQVSLACTSGTQEAAFQIVTVSMTGTQVSLHYNGLIDGVINNASMDLGLQTLDQLTFGAIRGSSLSSFGANQYGPILIYTSLADRVGAENWLREQGYAEPQHLDLRTFYSDGEYIAPAHGHAKVELWAAGGGGTADVGGGGGGAYARSFIQVSDGTDYDVVIGTSAVNTNGGNSVFDTNQVIAAGGKSGTNGSTGGQNVDSTGEVRFAGGNGGVGTGSRAGGGAAGDIANASLNSGGAHVGGSAIVGEGRPFATGGGSSAAVGTSGARGEARITVPVFPAPSYPVVRGRSWGRGNLDATTRNAVMPANIQAGERLVLLVVCDDDPVITVDGWMKIGQVTETSGNKCTIALFHKLAVGDDTATIVTSTAQTSTHTVWRIKNGGVPAWTTADGNSAAPNSPSLNLGATKKALWISAIGVDADGNSAIASHPTNYNAAISINQAGSTGVLGATSERLAEAQTEDPAAWALATSEQWVAATAGIEYVATPGNVLVPSNFGNLVALIDPRHGLTESGGSVTGWTERTGNYVAGVAGAPQYEATGWNGNPSVLFDGTDDGIFFNGLGPVFTGSDIPLYVIAAIQMVGTLVLNDYVFAFAAGASTVANCGLTIGTTPRWVMTRNDGAVNKFPTGALNSADNDKHVMSFLFGGTTGTLLEDGASVGLDAVDLDVGTITFTSFALAHRRNSTPTAFCEVRFGPVLIYKSLNDEAAARQWLITEGYGP